MQIPIEVKTDALSSAELKSLLENDENLKSQNIIFELKEAEIKKRLLAPEVLMAIVAAGGTGFGALIAGIFQLLGKSSERKITIKTEKGDHLEFPADLKQEQIINLVEKIKELKAQKIIIS